MEAAHKKQVRKKRFLLGGLAGSAVVGIIIIALAVTLRKKGDTKAKTSVLFPLYIYPDPGSWDPLHNLVTAHPKLNFTVVINPNNGPVAASELDDQYKSNLQRLNSRRNVRTIGYVSTDYGRRDINLVSSDISTYTGWSALAANGSIGVHGIFFDEVMANFTNINRDYMPTANRAVKSKVEFQPQQLIVHNNGVVPDYPQDSTTDLMVVFEGTYRQYRERQASLAALNNDDRMKRCLLMHSLPINQSKDDLKRLVKEVSQYAGALYLTDLSQDYYERFGLTLKDFVAAVASL